ncbi:MAG: Asp-tRNA(Asn)/Glu-tRNA(Gln) amidotransferase subunit GatA [Deferribacteres bacterium]|nr:Asp-tRNA(Asn)/Glu-tRNA(Gln) amidotransferase subunit GatA [Deferribacteres bacterium]
MKLYELTLTQVRDLVDKGEVKPSEVLEAVVGRIEKVEERVKAYITLTFDEAFSSVESKKLGRLSAVPIAVKDNICTKGIKTTCASKMLYNFVPPYDATVVKKMKKEGYVLIGKTNLDEFAMGSSTENSAFFTTRNPWDLERVPGGSSGGSAAAVAADMCIAAIGSDTGGSIRQPASFCGVVGLKPTYGRVSRYGLVAFASSLDQIGPITKTVEDAAYLLEVISGKDELDSTSAPVEVEKFTKALTGEVKGLKIALPKEYFSEGIDPEVKEAVLKCVRMLESEGAHVDEVSLPHTEYAISAYYIVAPAEASSNLARYDGVKYGFRAEEYTDLIDMYFKTRSQGFGNEVKRRIMLGTYSLASGYYDAYYLRAKKVRTLIRQDFERVFKDFDVIITPTSPTTAFKIGEKASDPLTMYLSDIFTVSVNLAGIPAVSIPCGMSGENLPIGLQVIGNFFEEAKILNVAYAVEKRINFRENNSPNLD